jgi:hypothetical protein
LTGSAVIKPCHEGTLLEVPNGSSAERCLLERKLAEPSRP